ILREQEIITAKSQEVAEKAFEEMLKALNKTEIIQAEMLFTHLPMALTRISKGEKLEGPSSDVLNEISNSEYFIIAEGQVEKIEGNWGTSLPKEEKDYLYMHYVTVINLNTEGGT